MMNKTVAVALFGLTFSCFGRAQSTLPTITVVASSLSSWADSGSYSSWTGMSSNVGMAAPPTVMLTMQVAKALGSVCKYKSLGAASEDAKSTTISSSVVARWLVAQEMFIKDQTKGILGLFMQLAGSNAVAVMVNGVRYDGYEVVYADGYGERWVVNPGQATSSIKLFDQPLPNSIRKRNDGCLTGG